MRSKEDLFQLIKAMSRSEKRYFTLDAKKSGKEGARYLELFQAINAMEHYDEAKLKKKFPRNLSSDKGYLYEAILRSMRDYRSATSKSARIKERLLDSVYLYERGLYEQSLDRLAEARALARELEDQFALLEINKEEQLYLYDLRSRAHLKRIEELNVEKEATLQAVYEELELLDLYFGLSLEVLRSFELKDEAAKAALRRRIDRLLAERRPQTPRAERRLLLCLAMYHKLLGENERVLEYFERAVEWWERHPAIREEEFHRYVIDVSNYINTCFQSNRRLDSVEKWIRRLHEQQERGSYHSQRIVFLKVSISNLLHLLNQGAFEEAYRLLPEITSRMKRFGLERSVPLLGNIITVCFLVGDYEQCIQWVDYLMKNAKPGSREDIKPLMLLYKLIALFELNRWDELEPAFRTVSRYFRKVGLDAGRFEWQVLNQHLKPIFHAPVLEWKPLRKAFAEFLDDYRNGRAGEAPFGVDELLLWANRSLATP